MNRTPGFNEGVWEAADLIVYHELLPGGGLRPCLVPRSCFFIWKPTADQQGGGKSRAAARLIADSPHVKYSRIEHSARPAAECFFQGALVPGEPRPSIFPVTVRLTCQPSVMIVTERSWQRSLVATSPIS